MLRWCWLATLAACGFTPPKAAGGDAAPGDAAAGDADPDGPPGMDGPPGDTRSGFCFGSFVEVCLVALPDAPFAVNSGETRTIDTSPGSADCAATTADAGACVVAATSIAVNGTLRGAGPRPLILLATVSIQVNLMGVIDVASRRGSPAGAGANPPACMPGSTPTEQTGGWGGSNAGRGGNGDQAGMGSSGGVASPALAPPTTLRGGCRGSKGAGGPGGAGGDGGGGVDLIAPMIFVDGTINASGAGAGGASNSGGGGGGGGSGGMIVLDSPDVTINGSGRVFAQGGGGGEGGGTTNGDDGEDGASPATPNVAAAGGDEGSQTGGNGGAGATTGDGGNGGPDTGLGPSGGGGGGGGAGFIKTTDPSPPTPLVTSVCPPLS